MYLGIILILISGTLAEDFKEGKIYAIANRQDTRLYLTGVNVYKSGSDSPVVVDQWRQSAGQKWRLQTYDASIRLLELRPTSSEHRVLSIDASKPELVSQQELYWYNRIGISNAVHQWLAVPTDAGFYLLKNYKTEQCLQNNGSSSQVGIGLCTNSVRQQWYLQSI